MVSRRSPAGRGAPPAERTLLARRRERFYDRIGESLALLFSAPEARYGHDTFHRYRPDPDLYYLTGFPEPEAAAVFDGAHRRFTLFVKPKDRERETWDGRRAGAAGARRDYGADEAHPIGELKTRLPEILRGASELRHAFGQSPEADALVIDCLARFRREARNPKRGPVGILDPTDVLHEMRLVKEPEELVLMEQSAAIACRAHHDVLGAAAPGRYEYELEAVLLSRFRAEGAISPAYTPIVASGPNATVLHYVENRRRIEAGDLVLVDAGCELEGYASDITRTFPASGSFSRVQRRLYDLVLSAQRAAIERVRPGKQYDDVHDTAREVMVDGLLELGLLHGRRAAILKKSLDRRFILHRTSHWLGLDVHDRGRYADEEGRPRVLVPGMVLTVEPGLYVRPDEKRVPGELLGLGVRIEDDVVVTEGPPRVLTEAAPKEPEALEELVGKGAPLRPGRSRRPR